MLLEHPNPFTITAPDPLLFMVLTMVPIGTDTTGIPKVITTTDDKIMSCQFSIPISMSFADTIKKVSAAIENDGGDFTPTDNGGSFNVPTAIGTIEGNFALSDGTAQVNITSKPFFLSCNTIQSKLTEYLQSESQT